MVAGILFDLDGTLHDREASVRELVVAQYGRFEAELAGVSRERYVARVLELDDHGYGDKAVLYRRLVSELGLRDELGAALTADFFEVYPAHARAFPEVAGVLVQLRGRGLKLGIITNGRVSVQERKLERLRLAASMDVVLISEREGLKKPDRVIFERALERLGLAADEAWYVGDHPVIDVKGAVDAGLGAVWRRTPFWHSPEVAHQAIDTLDELMSLV
jgi:putative hydrolase of the HAD superfamily